MGANQTPWGKIIAIVASVLGCIVIASCAAGSLLLGWCDSVLNPDPSVIAAQAAAMNARATLAGFTAALQRGDVEAARARGTDSFRAEWPAERLEELAARMSARLGKLDLGVPGDAVPFAGRAERPGVAGFVSTLQFEKGAARIEFQIAQQPGGTWLLESFEIESDLLGE